MTLDDQYEEAEARFREIALKVRKPVLRPTGICYYCGEPVKGVFCDLDCGNAYEHEQRQLKQLLGRNECTS